VDPNYDRSRARYRCDDRPARTLDFEASATVVCKVLNCLFPASLSVPARIFISKGAAMRREFVCGVVLTLAWGTTAKATNYTFVDLTPPGYTDFFPGGISDGHQFGGGSGPITGGVTHAILFSGTAASAVDLTPPGYTGSAPGGIFGNIQVGGGQLPGQPPHGNALLWNGTASSAVVFSIAGATITGFQGVYGNQEIGSAIYLGSTYDHAVLWPGGSASPVDLNPVGFERSEGLAISAAQQVGQGFLPGQNAHALLWTGSAGSAVDLNPVGFAVSQAMSVAGDQQVGLGQFLSGPDHALLWHSTAASAVDLNPAGANNSIALATNGTEQVGETVNYPFGAAGQAVTHAMHWNGTAASAVDLQPFVPVGTFLYSSAWNIDANGDILGVAWNIDNQRHLVEWVPVATTPEPGGLVLLTAVVLGMLRRRRWRAHARA
jgi:hypothetical protein